MILKRLVLGMLETNCYVLADTPGGESVVIDPAGEVKRISAALREHDLKLKAILLTHGHADHAAGAGSLSESTGAPVFIHPLDASGVASRRHLLLGLQAGVIPNRPREVQELQEGDEFMVGQLVLKTLYTPGHTPGGVSFHLPGHLFCGDFIFEGSIGRTDLRGGSLEALLDAVYEKVWDMPPDTVIHPGHGPETTLGKEKKSNPYLVGLDRRRLS